MIPRCIHQTWKSRVVPPGWSGFVRSWARHNPGWEHRLWTDADNRRLVEDCYPHLLAVYDGYPYPIQRADAARYLILHRYGGLYVDMDVECLRPVDPLLAGQSAVVVPEPPAHAVGGMRRPWLSIAFLAAVPGHPLLGDLAEALAQPPPRPAVTHRDVLAATGPGFLDRVFGEAPRPDVLVLDSRAIFPFVHHAAELRTMRTDGPDATQLKLSCVLAGTYAVHHWANSWSSLLGDTLVNPEPHAVAGFRFFPRLDSFGHDIRNAGRNVPELARACQAAGVAVAFNTDGFIKSRLRPRHDWIHDPARAENEGLYVKESALSGPLWRLLGVGRRSRVG